MAPVLKGEKTMRKKATLAVQIVIESRAGKSWRKVARRRW